MSRKVTATELRRNIYKLLDEVLESDIPLEVERKEGKIIISPGEKGSNIAGLRPHPDCIPGRPRRIDPH